MNKWGMKGIVLGLCLSMMVPMAVAMVPGISVEAAEIDETKLLEKAKDGILGKTGTKIHM